MDMAPIYSVFGYLPRHRTLKVLPKSRVELHCHLDGALRHETIHDLLKAKGMKLPGRGTLADLKEELRIDKPINLAWFLSKWELFHGAITDDLMAVERIAYEYAEDQAKDGVLYYETRMSPHLLLSHHSADHIKHVSSRSLEQYSSEASEADKEKMEKKVNMTLNKVDDLKVPGRGVFNPTPKDAVKAVLEGLKRGQEDFGVKGRLILACIRGFSEFAAEIAELCDEFRDKGVVGIDIAGDEGGLSPILGEDPEEKLTSPEELLAFNTCKEKGIHRTVHAGENGPPFMVDRALDLLHAERIGHGYAIANDNKVYNRVKRENVHLECCPVSSFVTGSVPLTCAGEHPIVRFAQDNLNFSINRDDPTVTFSTLSDEYRLLSDMGLTEAHFVRANMNAARSCFLPEKEKEELIDQLMDVYGVVKKWKK